MAAVLDIDKEQVQMLVLTYGVREAARMLGLSENTVSTWSARGAWLADRPASVPLPPSMVKAVKAPAPVIAQAQAMKDDALKGRAAALRVTRRALERADRYDDDELMVPDVAQVVNTYVKSAALAGGYSSSDAVAKIDLRVTGQRSDVGAIEAEIVQDNGFVE
jgi:hypothetical protein